MIFRVIGCNLRKLAVYSLRIIPKLCEILFCLNDRFFLNKGKFLIEGQDHIVFVLVSLAGSTDTGREVFSRC